ncbi:hypothetical protein [Allorhodopirellula heiligendammensis]|uniref:hypothetical protein n=1 Tax=Allorhodopirellula heiligendammensis TaxID=2714739 RepID=UPI0011B43B46|nr:hypothetical protein [Allorhodopirellula heiligendammensis]
MRRTEVAESPLLAIENHSSRLGCRNRYEIKLVLKPSVPCGASSDARAAATSASPAGHEATLPCGASTNACSARHCPTPDQLVTVTQCLCRTEVAGKPTGTTLN